MDFDKIIRQQADLSASVGLLDYFVKVHNLAPTPLGDGEPIKVYVLHIF